MRPTPTTWRLSWIGLGLLGAAINTGNNLLYLLLGLLVAAVPVDALGARRNLRRLSVRLLLPAHARAGDPFAVELELAHPGGRGDIRGIEVHVEDDRDVLGSAWVEKIPVGQTVRVAWAARCPVRGGLRVKRVRLASTFPLGVATRMRYLPSDASMTVLPARHAATVRDRSASRQRAGLGPLTSRVAGNEFDGLRRGGAHEDVRRVDWKSTARRGTLMLRDTLGEGQSRLKLPLVTRLGPATARARRRFEEEIARVGAIGEHQLATGGGLDLMLDGRLAERYDGPRAVLGFLSRLAEIVPCDAVGAPWPPDPSPEPSAVPVPPIPSVDDDETIRRSAAGNAHHGSVLLALAVGVTALFALGGIAGAVWLLIVVAIGAGLVWPDRVSCRPGGPMHYLWSAAGLLALGGFLADLLLRGHLLLASVNLVLFITAFVIFNARTTRDDRVVLLVSLMHVVLSAALTTEVSFAPLVIAWLFCAAHAQLAWASMPRFEHGPWRRWVQQPAVGRLPFRLRAAQATAAIVILGLAVFAVVPHLGTGTFSPTRGPRQTVSGFSDRASLGDIGRIKLDSSPVMDVELEGAAPAGFDLRWRGIALERFDGRTWTTEPARVEWVRSSGQGRFELPRDGRRAGGPELVQHVRLEPNDAGVLMAAERSERVVSDDFRFLTRDESGVLRGRTDRGRMLRYTVVSRPLVADAQRLEQSRGQDPPEVRRRNLPLPSLDTRVAELAQQLTRGTATRYGAVRAIELWLSTERPYSLDVRDRGVDDPLASFLFEGMAGHCEYFASAMVVLARSMDIPARLVTGYLRGESYRFGRRFTVRQSDAHAWVEVYFPGSGWVAFDPTPPAGRQSASNAGLLGLAANMHSSLKRWWDDYLIGVDLDDQFQRWIAIQRWLATHVGARGVTLTGLAGMSLLVLIWTMRRIGVAAWWIHRRLTRAGNDSSPPVFYLKLLNRLRRKGVIRQPHETPAELARRAEARLTPQEQAQVRELTAQYYRLRFGG